MFNFLQVRQVEYVDKMEEEWELFQKAMKEESHVSKFEPAQNKKEGLWN